MSKTAVLLPDGSPADADPATRADIERLARILERPHGRFTRQAAGKAPRAANAPFILSVGRPPNGLLWIVEYVLLCGDAPDTSTAIANVNAALFAGSLPTDASLTATLAGSVDYSNLVQTGLVVPSTTDMPDKCVVYSNEDLYAVFHGTGLSAGATTYHMVAGVIELPQSAQALLW